jgi:hypothetical protein
MDSQRNNKEGLTLTIENRKKKECNTKTRRKLKTDRDCTIVTPKEEKKKKPKCKLKRTTVCNVCLSGKGCVGMNELARLEGKRGWRMGRYPSDLSFDVDRLILLSCLQHVRESCLCIQELVSLLAWSTVLIQKREYSNCLQESHTFQLINKSQSRPQERNLNVWTISIQQRQKDTGK